MRRYLVAYLGAGLVLAALDAVWLTLASTAVYRATLGAELTPGFRPAPAIAFYLIYLVGVVIFAVAPALSSGRLREATWRGALFGVFCYATYDLTNQATLAVWSYRITMIDIAWGAFLTAVGATAGFAAARRVERR